MENFTIDENGCHNWTGGLNDAGYCVVFVYTKPDGRKKFEYIHRLSMYNKVGDYGNDIVIDHICGNTKCFNPDHLRLLYHAENAINSIEQKYG